MGLSLTRRDLLAGAAALAAAPKPNILFLFSDDHHYQCLGTAGNPHIRTPNLDRLAARGVNFVNGTISTAQCCPSRGVMLSGLETYQSGLLSNGSKQFRPGRGPTVVEQLRQGGYDTVLVGKWHITPTPAECGFARAPLWLTGGSSRYQGPELRRGLDGRAERVAGHITDLWADAARDYLRSARSPFLLWLAFNAPHTPWLAPDRYKQMYAGQEAASIAPPAHPKGGARFDWNTYYAVISHLDEAIGRVIAELERAKLWENTLVFFLGDNGYLCGTKGMQGKVAPYEESIRVPYFVSGGLAQPGLRCETPAASIDVPATWLDAAGLKPAYRLAGRSLKSLIGGGRGERDAAYTVWADGRRGALAGDRQHHPYRLARTRQHKLILWESGKQELYDWAADPGEERNLIGQERYGIVQRGLMDRLRARMRETEDPALKWPV